MKYTLKERKEKEYESIIEISELTSEVTPDALLDHYENVGKILTEQRKQIEVNNQLNEKALEICPQFKDIPEEHVNLALSYFGKIVANKQSAELIKECEESRATYETHLREIEKIMDIKILPELSPINPMLDNE